MGQIDWAPEARHDLQSIHEFLRRDNPGAAELLAKAIDEAARGLAAFPRKGHKGLDGTREWVIPRFRRYLLIYDVETWRRGRASSPSFASGISRDIAEEKLGIV